MPPILNTNAVIVCPHGGRVTLIPRQAQVSVGGAFALCEPDLVGAPIVGCAKPPGPGSVPCKLVAVVLPGSTSMIVSVGGRPAYVQTLTGLTNGVPPAPITVVFPGQVTVGG
jgi:hypothetical protein